MWPPVLELLQVFGHTLGKKDVAGIATIHYSLGDINSAARHVCAAVHVHHAANWAAVHTYAQAQTRVPLFERATDFQRALHRVFRAMVKDQRHAIAGGEFEQAILSFRLAILVR